MAPESFLIKKLIRSVNLASIIAQYRLQFMKLVASGRQNLKKNVIRVFIVTKIIQKRRFRFHKLVK